MTSNKPEKVRYTTTQIVFGNLTVIAWGLLGTATVALFNIFAAIGYLAVAAFLVYYKLGKKGCLSCFLCETCTVGMGKLFDVFFTKRGTQNLNRKALKLFPVVYLWLSVVPIVLISVSLAFDFTVLKVLLLAGLLVFSVFSGVVRRNVLVPRKH
jgi:hypothetical protein